MCIKGNVKMVETSNHVIFKTVDTLLAESFRFFLDKRLLLERSKRLFIVASRGFGVWANSKQNSGLW